MKYFITGATGFIGGAVARKLRSGGNDVVAIVRNPSKAGDLIAAGVTVVKGDVTNMESMRSPMTGADGVFHIAGWYKIGVRDRAEAVAINVDGTRNVLSLMRDLNIPKGVYTSTLAVNSDTHGVEADESYRFTGRHLSLYDQTKADAHAIAEDFIAAGLPLVIVQPGLVYGPGDTSAAREAIVQTLSRKLPLVPLKTAYSWGHIDDIADGHIAAMARGRAGQNYNLCGPSRTLLNGLEIVSRVSGVPLPVMRPGPGVMRAMAGFMSFLEYAAPLPPNFSSEFLRVSAGVTYLGANAKARDELGFAPRPLETGLADTVAHEMRLLGMRQA
ncbi:MAG: NAD-dependent epimerase/dehydratase family protein [Thermoflexales bacterium]|nr:NAD-dependent epimerase/dehydratase family protein [Thermoflexales bacterium]